MKSTLQTGLVEALYMRAQAASRSMLAHWTTTPETLGTAVSIYILIMFNHQFFHRLWMAYGSQGLSDWPFRISSLILAAIIIRFFVTLFAFKHVYKIWLTLLLLTGATSSFYIDNYNVLLDRDMVRNILQTDWQEGSELITASFWLRFILLGILPAAMISFVPVSYPGMLRSWMVKLGGFCLSLLLIGLILVFNMQDYASIFRNHRDLRYQLIPSGYLYSLTTYALEGMNHSHHALQQIGLDAHQITSPAVRQKVLILVVGETARAQNFSLSGYSKETNPLLKKENLVYFKQVHSCGTATAISLPCMFSRNGKSNFSADDAVYQENLLDVLDHANIDVFWRDNNSGCKGVCNRVPNESLTDKPVEDLCQNNECFDMALLNHLQQRIENARRDIVIVLHQKGSHGPAYSERTPREFQFFHPACHSSDLQNCSLTELENAYDNSIRYTDFVLASAIDLLKQLNTHYSTAMLYVSDHGESLGENNLFLHGLPYAIAPEQQTHIPMLLWMSDDFAFERGINTDCVQASHNKPFSHDNLFDTVLDLMAVNTKVYQPENSILRPCLVDSDG